MDNRRLVVQFCEWSGAVHGYVYIQVIHVSTFSSNWICSLHIAKDIITCSNVEQSLNPQQPARHVLVHPTQSLATIYSFFFFFNFFFLAIHVHPPDHVGPLLLPFTANVVSSGS